MNHLEHPSLSLWEERRRWFEKVEEEARGEGNYLVSEQACALIAEAQSVFCAGAWVAFILLAASIIDAQLRETELPSWKGNTKDLLHRLVDNQELDWLRLRRNALVHVNPHHPAITIDDQWFNGDKLELDARKALKLVFETFYFNPST